MINYTFGFIIFVQFLVSSIVTANTVFQASVNGVRSEETLKALSFLYGAILEIFLYCYFGNRLTSKVIFFTNNFLIVTYKK